MAHLLSPVRLSSSQKGGDAQISSITDHGSGNMGSGKTGSDNTGSGKTGSGNTGSGNAGFGNAGFGNTGFGNTVPRRSSFLLTAETCNLQPLHRLYRLTIKRRQLP